MATKTSGPAKIAGPKKGASVSKAGSTANKASKSSTKGGLRPKARSVSPAQIDQLERKRRLPKYASFRLSKRLPHPAGSLPSALVISKKARTLLLKNWRPVLGIILVYGILYIVLVRGFSSPLDILSLKSNLSQTLGANMSKLTFTGAALAMLVGSSGSNNAQSAGTFHTILLVILTLALIWVFRQFAAGNKPTTRGAFYLGMYPLIPFVLVLLCMLLQTTPMFLAIFLFNIVIGGGFAVNGFEQALWFIFFGGLALLSLYMLTSSLFALYIVTLPDMTPLKALRSAGGLVFSRRLSIARKLLALPVILLLLIVIVVVPAIYFIPVVAPWVYFALTLVGLLYLHAYLFTLYRELL